MPRSPDLAAMLLYSGMEIAKICEGIRSWELAWDILQMAANARNSPVALAALAELEVRLSEALQPALYLQAWATPSEGSFSYGHLLEGYLAQLVNRQPAAGNCMAAVEAIRCAGRRRGDLSALHTELADFAAGMLELLCGQTARKA